MEQTEQTRGPSAGQDQDRLESWKEISAYLKRDIRTLRRWEKNEGLPVHRHMHDKLSTVYAFRSELDAWWASRKPRLQEAEQQAAVASRPRWLPWAAAASGLALLLLVLAALLLPRPGAPPPSFEERPWVLISHFENRTGEPVFDGALEYALERELSSSQFVNVASRERVQDTLQLMQKPTDTVIDRALGREVALRDGGIRAVVVGRVEKLGSAYVLSALLVEPAQGSAVASFSEQVAGHEQVVEAIRRLSDSVRHSLGEELAHIRKSELELQRVTTPSLRALHLYSQGYALALDFQSAQAAAVLRQAVAEDPEFASAHALLGGILMRLGEREEAGAHYQRAFDLAERTTQREQLYIQALYHNEAKQDAQSGLETLTLLVRLYPDHYLAVSNLVVAHMTRGQAAEALPYLLRRADLRPGYFDHQIRAAQGLALLGAAEKAALYLQRARALAAADETPLGRWRDGWLSAFAAQARWAAGDVEGALREARALSRKMEDAGAGQERREHPWHLASFYLVLGQRAAVQEQVTPANTRPADLALLAWARGDEAAALRHLQRTPAAYHTAILRARLGALAEAERDLASPESPSRVHSPFLPSVWRALAAGELAQARGAPVEAIPLLEDAFRHLDNWPTAYFFMGAESLSRAWEQQGDLEKSLQALERASRQGRASVFWGPAPLFWMKNELRRIGLYRRLGREEDARRVEADLRKLLVVADPDHFILRALDTRDVPSRPAAGDWLRRD